MHPQQNPSDSSFGGHWYHQIPNQTSLPSSAPPTYYADPEDAPPQETSYSFAPSYSSFYLRNGFDELPSIRPSLSNTSSIEFASTVQPIPTNSAVESRLPSLQDIAETDNSQEDQSHERPMQPPPKPRKSMSRTHTLAPSDWEKHRAKIRSLWIDGKKTLPETMEIMAEKFEFKPTYVLSLTEVADVAHGFKLISHIIFIGLSSTRSSSESGSGQSTCQQTNIYGWRRRPPRGSVRRTRIHSLSIVVRRTQRKNFSNASKERRFNWKRQWFRPV